MILMMMMIMMIRINLHSSGNRNYSATTEAEATTITQNQKQKQKKKDVRYIGGWVITPTPGEYRNVSVFDVTSLYPTMIVNNNISFETVDCICCADNPQARVPDYIFDGQDININITFVLSTLEF